MAFHVTWIDIVFAAILLLSVYHSTMRGFFASVSHLLAIGLSCLCAKNLDFGLAEILENRFFSPLVKQFMDKTVDKIMTQVDSGVEGVASSLKETLMPLIEKLEYVGIDTGITEDSFSGAAVGEDIEAYAVRISEELTADIAGKAAKAAAVLFIFLIAYCIFVFIASVIGKFVKLPLVHHLDAFLGGVCGFIFGSICVIIIAVIIKTVLLPLASDEMPLTAFQNSIILSLFPM